MKNVCEKNKCNGCFLCKEICPKKCIKILDSIAHFNAEINEEECINCKMCKKYCPNINKIEKKKPIIWKQGWSLSTVRNYSTSGGIASEIIKKFIQSGGYVASCLFKDGEFIFDITNDLKIAKKFAGSKYVKSNPDGIFKKVKKTLNIAPVLFIGLPCQVAGLKNYIKEDENLYTIDLICHGTPSVKLLDMYLKERNYNLFQLDDIKFRNKNDYGLMINNKKMELPNVMDHYLCSFIEAVSFTDNCYNCNYASIERISDITLGDSWGTKYEEEAKKGISLVLCQTQKGLDLLEASNIELRDVDVDKAIENNKQLTHPSLLTPKRKKFFYCLFKTKNFKISTFVAIPKTVLKQKIKKLLIFLHVLH